MTPHLCTRYDEKCVADYESRCLRNTLGARDFSSAIAGSVKSFSRGFGLRPKMCRPSANTENSRCAREKPLLPRVLTQARLTIQIW